jgi:predicted branched-subunit amino acid permease
MLLGMTTKTATRTPEAVRGAATMLPLLVGYAPFALLIGVAAGRSADPLAAWAGGLLIFGGTAHLTVIEQITDGSGLAAVVATGLLINGRLSVYSASLAPLWRDAPLPHRLVAAAAVIDPTWAVANRREAEPGSVNQRRRHFLGAAAALAFGWSAMIGVGIGLGAQPSGGSLLSVCTPLCLAAIVGPHLRSSAGVRCVVAAACVALLTTDWPAGTGLIAAMAAGAAAGVLGGRSS